MDRLLLEAFFFLSDCSFSTIYSFIPQLKFYIIECPLNLSAHPRPEAIESGWQIRYNKCEDQL